MVRVIIGKCNQKTHTPTNKQKIVLFSSLLKLGKVCISLLYIWLQSCVHHTLCDVSSVPAFYVVGTQQGVHVSKEVFLLHQFEILSNSFLILSKSTCLCLLYLRGGCLINLFLFGC